MKKFNFIFILSLIGSIVFAQQDNLPANPTPGKCYVKCITPDEYTEVEETVVLQPAFKTIKTYPATYKTVEERVMVKEASKKLVYVPAVYETVTVDYVTKQGGNNLGVKPASFSTGSQQFEVSPASTGWEYNIDPNCTSINKNDCLIACFKEYPAKTESVSVQTLVNDATTYAIPVAERTASYTKQVVKTPARMQEVEIPAQFRTITKQVVDRPARTEEVNVPAQTKTVTRTVLAKKGGSTVWEELDCNLLSPTILPILYPLNSGALTADAKRIIDENLYNFLMEKPLVKVEIMSHTDSRGSDSYNKALSQQRAQSVVNYLVSKGISRDRLLANGYGETRLKNRCSNGVQCSDSEHQANRRTEFRVVQ